MMKKAICTLLAVATITALAGCSGENAKNIATYQGGEIPAGVYIYTQNENLSSISYFLGTDGLLDQKIGEQTVRDMVNETSVEAMQRFAAIESEFTRLGLTVNQEDLDEITGQLDRAWDTEGKAMEKKGVAKSSVIAVAVNNLKSNALFEAYYQEGGERAVSKADLEAYYNENYRRALLLQMDKSDEAGKALEGEALTKRLAEINGYYDRAQKGEKLFDLMKEWAVVTGESVPADVTEETTIVQIKKTGSSFPALFVEELFASTEIDKVKKHDAGDMEIIYEAKTLMPAGGLDEATLDTLLYEMKDTEFKEKLLETATSIGFSMNDAASKRYTLDELLKR